MTNIEKYKDDLKKLIKKGEKLLLSLQYEFWTEDLLKIIKEKYKTEEEVKAYIKNILSFRNEYQNWYSESLILIKQLLPERLTDFIKFYEKSKTRKVIEYGNYVVEDYLQNLSVTLRGETKVGPSAVMHQYEQQLNVLKSVEQRFESSLFDIKQLVQADLFDSELDAAKELNKKKFTRGAGAVAGVVLEKHLAQVLSNHALVIAKKNPTISELNDHLKTSGVYDTPTWRKIQHLGDIRNLCDHSKEREPQKEEVDELITGVGAIIKTVY